jgi:hypothetical protein
MTKSQNGISCDATYGPTFRDSYAIYVSNECDMAATSHTKLDGVYLSDTGIDGTKVFTGEQYFRVKDIEVFSIDQ